MPLKNQPSDINATQRAWDFSEGWFANPVYVNGDYPQSVKEYVSTFGLNFTDEQKELIKGTADNFSEDAYIFAFYSAPDVGIDNCLAESSHPLYPYCFDISYTGPTGWLVGASSDPSTPWIQSATEWVPALLRYIQETWKPSGGIVVAEFGFTEPYEHLKTQKADILMDPLRSMYYRKFMEAILIAISEGVKVVGCFSWSLMDNLEWQLGKALLPVLTTCLTFQATARSLDCNMSISRRSREATRPHSLSILMPSRYMLKIPWYQFLYQGLKRERRFRPKKLVTRRDTLILAKPLIAVQDPWYFDA